MLNKTTIEIIQTEDGISVTQPELSDVAELNLVATTLRILAVEPDFPKFMAQVAAAMNEQDVQEVVDEA